MNYSVVEYGGQTIPTQENFDLNSNDDSVQYYKDPSQSLTSIENTGPSVHHHNHKPPKEEPQRSIFQKVTNDRFNSILFKLNSENRKNKRFDKPHINHNFQKIEEINNFISKYTSAIDVYQKEMKRVQEIEVQENLRQEYIKTWKTLTGYATKIKSIKNELIKLRGQHNAQLNKILEMSTLDRKGLY